MCAASNSEIEDCTENQVKRSKLLYDLLKKNFLPVLKSIDFLVRSIDLSDPILDD